MKTRISFSAKTWLLSAATGFILAPTLSLVAQTDDSGAGATKQPAPQAAAKTNETQSKSQPGAKSPVQRELDKLYAQHGRKAPTMSTTTAARRFPTTGASSNRGTTVRRPTLTQKPAAKKPGLGLSSFLQRILPDNSPSKPQAANAKQPASLATTTAPKHAYYPRNGLSTTAKATAPQSDPKMQVAKSRRRRGRVSYANSFARQFGSDRRDAKKMVQQASAATTAGQKNSATEVAAGVPANQQEGPNVQKPPKTIGEFLKQRFPFVKPSSRPMTSQPRRLNTPPTARRVASKTRKPPKQTRKPQQGSKPQQSGKPATLAELLRQGAKKLSSKPSIAAKSDDSASNSIAKKSLIPSDLATSKPQPPKPADTSVAAKSTPQDPKPVESNASPAEPAKLPAAENVAAVAKPETKPAKPSEDDESLSAFPDGSEAAADAQSSPFSGKTLDDETAVAKSSETTDDDAPASPKPLPEDDADGNVKQAVAQDSADESKAKQPKIQPAQSVSADTSPRSILAEERRKKMELISKRDGTGLKGFCPVALRDERELKDAKPEFTATYDSHTYQFCSAEAKAEFEKNPAAYVPVSQGLDVVALNKSNEKKEGLLDNAVWYKDRLYLFSSRESLREFFTEPTKYCQDEKPAKD